MTHGFRSDDVADRALTMSPSPIRRVAEQAHGRDDIIPLFYGEGCWQTDPEIVAAGTGALSKGAHFYTPNAGLPELRHAIAAYYQDDLGLDIAPERIVVTGSGMQALALAAQALVNTGDRAIVVTPVWPNMPETLKLVGAHIQRFDLTPDARGLWQLDVDALCEAITPEVRVVLFNSPNNPTGWTATAEELSKLRQRARETGTWLIGDDVYQRLTFDTPSAPSILSGATDNDRIVSVNSFSKAWSMTGWRLGWLVVPEPVARTLEPLTEFNISCVAPFTQAAGMVALSHTDRLVAELMARLRSGRSIIADGLGTLSGVRYAPAPGTFYAFFQLEGLDDSYRAAEKLLHAEGLGVAPGVAFGAEGWLRLCFAQEPETLMNAVRALESFLGGAERDQT